MYEIHPKFFNKDGSLDVEAACAAGRKARAHIVGEVVKHTSSSITKAARAFYEAIGKLTLRMPTKLPSDIHALSYFKSHRTNRAAP